MLIGYDPYGGTMQRFTALEIIREVAKCGYDAINLPVRKDFADPENETQLRAMQELIGSLGLKTPSVGVTPHTWAEPGKAAETRKGIDQSIVIAKRFNARLLTMWPRLPPNVQHADAMRAFTESVQYAVPAATAAGLSVAIEFEKNSTVDNYRDGLAFVAATDARVRLVADTYHMNNDKADPHASVLAMRGQIGEVHLSGTHRGEPGSAGDTYDYAAFVRGLKETGFDGPVMLQYNLQDPVSIGRACQFARRLFGR